MQLDSMSYAHSKSEKPHLAPQESSLLEMESNGALSENDTISVHESSVLRCMRILHVYLLGSRCRGGVLQSAEYIIEPNGFASESHIVAAEGGSSKRRDRSAGPLPTRDCERFPSHFI